MTDAAETDEEFTELRDAVIGRMDGVGETANGTQFLIAKGTAGAGRGLLAPDFVRDLIAKSETAAQPQETVTMTGSPAAIAAMLIHGAPIRKAEAAPVAKAKYNADDLKRMSASGAAMKDGSYPIADEDDLDRAIRAVGRGGASHDAIRHHIEQRAKSLGMTSKIPDNWAADGSLKKGTGEMGDAADDLDPTTVLAEPGMDAPGDPADPGSPAWEAIDAATARKWTAILARACNALCTMAEREMLEAAAGDSDDADAAFDLEDAKCAIDYAISVLAPFAVGEQAEADLGTEALAAVGKALDGFDAGQLDVVEALAPVAKAGRVLSAGNEAAIRAAADALQKVLASLPAPLADSGQPVAKQTQETTMTAPAASETPAAEVAKADAEAQVAVYTADGVLFGTVAPDAVMAVAQPEAPEGSEPDGDEDEPDGAADMVEEAAAEPVVEPDEDAEVIPGTSTVASPAPDEDEVTKAVQAKFNTALAEALKPFTEELARSAELADVVKGLQERVEHLAAMPDDRKSPLLNGATGTGAGIASRDGSAADPLAELKKAVDDAPNEAARTQAQTALGIAAIKARFAS